VLAQENKQRLYFIARPGGFAQKCETAFDAGIVRETANLYLATQIFPTIIFYQMLQHLF
jgi:hypothetical protein